MSPGSSGSLGVRLAVVTMCLVWGSTWFVLQDGLSEMKPLGSAGLRFGLAWLLMLPLAGPIARREGGDSPPARLVAVMAVGNYALSFGIVYWAEQTLPSGLTAVLWAVFPLMTAAVGHFTLAEGRVVGVQWFGLALGLAGVALLFATDVTAVGGDALERALVLLLSPLIAALATAYVKKHGGGVSSALLNRSALFWGSSLLLLGALTIEGGVTFPSSGRAALGLLYLAGVGSVLAFTLYFWVLRRASAVALSLITYVTPAVALLLGAALGEERVTAWTIAGLALVLVGCAIVLRRAAPRPSGGGGADRIDSGREPRAAAT